MANDCGLASIRFDPAVVVLVTVIILAFASLAVGVRVGAGGGDGARAGEAAPPGTTWAF